MNRKITSLLLLLIPFIGFSQKQIAVEETSQSMSLGSHPGFKTEIPEGVFKEVERDWKKYLNSAGKGKMSDANGEIVVRGIDNKTISQSKFNIYSKLTATGTGVSLVAWFTTNDTVFFSKKPGGAEAADAQRYIRDFATAEYFLAIREAAKREKDKLEKLKDELEKKIREEEKSTTLIADNKRAIARAQEDISDNQAEQKTVSSEITLRQAELAKARSAGGDIYKAADHALKEEEDRKKKLASHAEDLHKKIDNWNKEIITETRDVNNSTTEQKQITDSIAKQKQVVADIENKLKGIK
ncbi:MAG: hypothetical protein JWO06_227 [Bacteroidota bacterium]|nr:hypothetical protein [Bacteroidota bacterium]